jgi:hypothetical protein
VEEVWALKGSFDLVGKELHIGVITPAITDVSGMIQAWTTRGFLRIVAGDGMIFRWWDNYVLAIGGWLLIETQHLVVDDGSDEEARGVDEVVVSENVDDEDGEEEGRVA